jgi:hypothetical protein
LSFFLSARLARLQLLICPKLHVAMYGRIDNLGGRG